MIQYFLLLIPLIIGQLHPFHVSVCDIEFNKESKSVQVSQRIFMDDFEQALSKRFGINLIIDDKSKTAYRDSLIQIYLFENFHLTIDGKEKDRAYVGNEVEEDAMWCYFEYTGVKKLSSIKVSSTILLEKFDDQANIIHFKYGDYERSIKLDNNKKVGIISVDNQ